MDDRRWSMVHGLLSIIAKPRLHFIRHLCSELLEFVLRALFGGGESIGKQRPAAGVIEVHVGVRIIREQAISQVIASGDERQPIPKVNFAGLQARVLQNLRVQRANLGWFR